MRVAEIIRLKLESKKYRNLLPMVKITRVLIYSVSWRKVSYFTFYVFPKVKKMVLQIICTSFELLFCRVKTQLFPFIISSFVAWIYPGKKVFLEGWWTNNWGKRWKYFGDEREKMVKRKATLEILLAFFEVCWLKMGSGSVWRKKSAILLMYHLVWLRGFLPICWWRNFFFWDT